MDPQGRSESFFCLLTYNAVRAEKHGVWAMWIDPVVLRVPIFITTSVLTHCLGPLPLKQTTKGSLWGTDTILGTELYAANISGDVRYTQKRQVMFAMCPEKSSRLMPFILCIHKTQSAALLLCLFTGTLLESRGCFAQHAATSGKMYAIINTNHT